MKNNKYFILIFFFLLTLVSCGRKGDLFPPPDINFNYSLDYIMEKNNDKF